MSRMKPLSTLRALLFAGAALFMTAVAVPSASASEVNQSFPAQTNVDENHAQPVLDCQPDELSCGDDLCCVGGDECCMPPNDVPYCAKIC